MESSVNFSSLSLSVLGCIFSELKHAPKVVYIHQRRWASPYWPSCRFWGWSWVTFFWGGKVETEKFSKETGESFSWRCFGQYIFEVQTMRGFRRIIWDLYHFCLRVLPSPCPCVCWWWSVVVPRCRAQAEAMDFGCYRCVWLVSLLDLVGNLPVAMAPIRHPGYWSVLT